MCFAARLRHSGQNTDSSKMSRNTCQHPEDSPPCQRRGSVCVSVSLTVIKHEVGKTMTEGNMSKSVKQHYSCPWSQIIRVTESGENGRQQHKTSPKSYLIHPPSPVWKERPLPLSP